jgi:hypothetical protein
MWEVKDLPFKLELEEGMVCSVLKNSDGNIEAISISTPRPYKPDPTLRSCLRVNKKMSDKLVEAIESGQFWEKFNHCIYSIGDDNILCNWLGKYVCEIQKFSIQKYSDKKYHFSLEIDSDSGLGPRIYVKEEEIEDFLQGKPCSDGSYLCGKGIAKFLEEL